MASRMVHSRPGRMSSEIQSNAMATVRTIARLCLHITAMCLHVCVSVPPIAVVEMDRVCGETLNISSPVLLRLTAKGENYGPNMQCGLNLVADSGHRLIIGVRSVNIHIKSNTTCHDYLDILAVYESTSRSMSGRICHSNRYPATSMRTLQSKAKILFTSDSSGEDKGFELLLTPFHTGYCNENEYDCRSAQCIPIDVNFVNCNTSYNYCGDDSDYCPKSDNTDLFVLTYIVTGLFPILFTVALCTWHYRRSGKKTSIPGSAIPERTLESHADECIPTNRSSTPGLPPPGYSPPCPPPAYSVLPKRTASTRENYKDTLKHHLSERERTLDQTPPPSYSEICG